MASRLRLIALVLGLGVLLLALPAALDAQGRGRGGGQPGQRAVPRTTVVIEGRVFIGGYFYDPVFGPYPWWTPARYPYRYFPVYDHRAQVRVQVKPREAAVYVDGFYAGIVDDFDGVFQRLPLPPGGHEIVLYLEGYRTIRHNLYLYPGSTFSLRGTLAPLAPGDRSAPPRMAPPLPPPPPGSYEPPRSVAPRVSVAPRPAAPVTGFGTLTLRVQPAGATVLIDGERWVSSDGEHFVIDLAAGVHDVEVSLEGYRPFSDRVEIADDETTPLNVSLSRGGR